MINVGTAGPCCVTTTFDGKLDILLLLSDLADKSDNGRNVTSRRRGDKTLWMNCRFLDGEI